MKAIIAALLFLLLGTSSVLGMGFDDLKRLAETGDAESQRLLAVRYATGDGVSQNHEEAFKWYELAAQQGNVRAQYGLGVMYATGTGVPQNDREAVKWYELAAKQGDGRAQSALGMIYEAGTGVPRDHIYAYAWYNLAAAQGDEGAGRGRDRLYPKMTSRQITAAKKLSETLQTQIQKSKISN